MHHFEIKTEKFQGPMDLLLTLIEKKKLLINDISLSQITDEYISFIKENEIEIHNKSDFIVTASTLLLIKSKSLLPTLELSKDEESDIENLERRLKIYKRIKGTEDYIKAMFGRKISFFGGVYFKDKKYFIPNEKINPENISNIIKGILNSLPKKEITPTAKIKKVISLNEMIERLTDRIRGSLSFSFKEFSNFKTENKVNIIVSFLAMLELTKEGIIEVEQTEQNSDISINTKTVNTPKYT